MGILGFLIYFLAGFLIVWSVSYLICDLRRRLKGGQGCGCGCGSCPHGHCRRRKAPRGSADRPAFPPPPAEK